MVKNIHFIEKENKPLFDVELTVEYLMNDIYKNIIDYYKENKINDIILIDHRLDTWRNKLIGCKFLENNNLMMGTNKYLYVFNKNNFIVRYGFLCKETPTYIFIKGKQTSYKIIKKDYYIFYKNNMTKKEKENEKLRNCLENLLNKKIRIKKIN